MRGEARPDVYWATLPTREFCDAAIARIRVYRQWLLDSGRLERMVRAWRCAYGRAPDGEGDASKILRSGDQGELLEVTTNEFMGLVTQTISLLLNNKPACKPRAKNSDFSSLTATRVASALLDSYEETLALPDRDAEAALLAVVLGEAWEVFGWDASKGEVEVADEQGDVKQGDVTCVTVGPTEIAFDPDTQDADRLQWFGHRVRVNRHDAAVALEGADLGASPEAADARGRALEVLRYGKTADRDELDVSCEALGLTMPGASVRAGDLTWVWEFRILPSPACKPGRLVRFVTPDCVLYDSAAEDAQGKTGGYPYAELHAHQLKPDVVPGSVAGNTHHHDLLSLQQGLDNCLTQMATAANSGGIQTLWSPPGGDPVPTEIGDGISMIQTAVKPERLEGPTIDPQAVGFSQVLLEFMRRRIGLNDVAVGEPSKGMPAQLAALLQAQAVQYHNRLQASYARLISKGRSGLIALLQKYADTKRVALMAGKGNAWAVKEWVGSDLDPIARVEVEEVPAYLKTTAGRMQLLDIAVEHGWVQNRQEGLLLITTGRWDSVYGGAEANLLRIQRDRELLMEGVGLPPVDVVASQQAMAQAAASGRDPSKVLPLFAEDGTPHLWPLATDTHWLDIPEYLSVISSPESRQGNDKVVGNVLAIVDYKLKLWRQMDPVLMALLGCPPEMAALVMQGVMPMMPPGGAPPPAPPGGPQKAVPQMPGLPSGGPSVRAPKPPKDPLTGEQAPPPMGA